MVCTCSLAFSYAWSYFVGNGTAIYRRASGTKNKPGLCHFYRGLFKEYARICLDGNHALVK